MQSDADTIPTSLPESRLDLGPPEVPDQQAPCIRGMNEKSRGIAMVPRRLSEIERTDTQEMHFIGSLLTASPPPSRMAEEILLVIEEHFFSVPLLLRELSGQSDHQEIEILLCRRTRKLIESLQGMRGLNNTMKRRVSTRFTLFVKQDKSSPETENDFSTDEEFKEWLKEFLFMLWCSSLPDQVCEEAALISSIREACKQIVYRTVHHRELLNRNRWYMSLVKLLPWRFRLRLGDRGPFGERKWEDLIYEPFERDRMKAQFSSSKQPMHWLTREFNDPGLEKSFQVDRARRLLRNGSYYSFFLTVALAIGYVLIRYGLLSDEYPSITIVRLILTEPVSFLIMAAFTQLVAHTVLFDDNQNYLENFFLYQFVLALAVCCLTATWMYQVRKIFLFVVWPINEGFTMAFVLLCTSCLFYVRFIYLVWLTTVTALWTVLMRAVAADPNSTFSPFSLQQWIAILGAIILVLGARYSFETHTRMDFILTRNLFIEAEKSDQLLRNILPSKVIEHFKANSSGDSSGIAEAHDNVTILFADVCGFTTFSSHVSPHELVLFLNDLFHCFDDIAEQCGLEKIKTIGDAYMAVAFQKPPEDGASAAARMGLMIVDLMMTGRFRDHQNEPLQVRVGIHTGSCVAGVIGRRKFIYDIWGDAVNTASRMESTGDNNRVHCSQATASLLVSAPFELESRGDIEVKGKGSMVTYFVN